MKKVIICGLGAVGLTIAAKIKNKCDLKIIADIERIKRYKVQKPVFNDEEQVFQYLSPFQNFEPDLIIITTKYSGLFSAIKNIKNFVGKNTIIISLINGISSEDKIVECLPNANVLKSYFVGHSAIRSGNSVTQDGIWEIVVENNPKIIEIFDELKINYSISENIDYSM